MDTTNFWTLAVDYFWVLFSGTILILLIKIYIASKADRLDTSSMEVQGASTVESSWLIFKVLILSLEQFSNVLFWYMVIMTGVWFIYFKFQARVVWFFPISPEISEESF